MAEADDGVEAHERRRDKFGQFLQKTYNKSELALKHAIGLGAGQNVVPISQPSSNGPPRPVHVGWHPVGGFAGKWFAEKTGLGKMITERINNYPDPTQHWAVLVGDYAHQLWMDENFDIIYTNAKVDPKEWKSFPIGETRFNDDAMRRAGEAVIQNIRITRPGYNLISNNCQTYVLQLLDAIQVSQEKEFGTTLAVYERLFGSGKVADLFVDDQGNSHTFTPPAAQTPSSEQEVGVIGGSGGYQQAPVHHPETMQYQGPTYPAQAPQTSVAFAQQVMNANTTQLNTEQEAQRNIDDDEPEPEHKSKGWAGKISSFSRKFKK